MNEPVPFAPQNRSTRSAKLSNYLHRYKNLLRKRWWVLLVTIVLALGAQFARIQTAPPIFASVGRMFMTPKLNVGVGTASYIEEYNNFLNTQIILMKSPTVLERATERVHALKPGVKPVRVEMLPSVSPKTTIFIMQAQGGEPEYVRAYLDACMDAFLQLKKDIRGNISANTQEKLLEQVKDLEGDIKKYREEERAFNTTNNVVFIQEEVTSISGYLVTKNRSLDASRSEYKVRMSLSLDQNLEQGSKKEVFPGTGGDDRGMVNPALASLQDDYRKAQQDLQLKKNELAEWSDILKPKHPRIIALNEEIARREKYLLIVKNQGKGQLDRLRDGLFVTITNLESDVKDLEVRSLDLKAKLAQYDRIHTDLLRSQASYDRLQLAIGSVKQEAEINPDSVTILEHASPAMLVQSSLVKSLIIAGALGLIVGLVTLLIVDWHDDRPTSFTDLQEVFDEPVLGQIPLEFSKNGKGGVHLIQTDDERHAFMEAYRNLRSSLLYMATQGKRPRLILVTSAIPSDGKSTTTANLAITMALSGSRVLLVDGDMRKGLIHKHFGLQPTPGLNEVLTNQIPWREAIQSTTTPNLSIIPRGNTARNPGEMFLSPTSLDLIREFATQYDYVILDTAPVMAADDVTSLAPHMEGVIFVIRANYTSARIARAALDLLYQREVNVLGLVFNGVQTNASEYYYYRYKDYYSDHKRA